MAIIAQAQITLSCVVDVEATYRYYLLQSSTLSKPSKPTANPPTGSWNDTEPTYTAGSTNSLYFVDLTVFSDGTFAYSAVSLSSSYEAAKAAYNKAQSAQTTADNAQTTASSKNSIFYQASAPSTSGRKLYDIWFDTDDGNRMYYFNGSSWVQKQFGTNAIADSTIIARLIASNTITGDKIVASAITAEKIAANAVTANAIAAGAVTAAKISVTDLYAIGATIAGWTITSGKIYGGDDSTGVAVMQRPSSNMTYVFAAGGTNHSNYADCPFRVTKEGKLYSTSAEIEGKIIATSGTIGGWTISSTKIYGGDSTTGVAAIQLPTENNLYAFAAGGTSHSSYADCPFRVTKNGKLYSSDFVIGPLYSSGEDVYCSKAMFVQYGMELFADNDAGQPYIDFHYGKVFGSTNDYTSRILAYSANGIAFKPSYDYTETVQVLREVSGSYRMVLRSSTNGGGYLGTTSFRWNTAFFTNAITASDRKIKNILGDIDNAADFIMSLKPYKYTFKDGDSGRTHMGLIAQEVAQTAKDLNMGDLALYQASVIHEDGTESYYDESVPDGQLSWGLNYNELIAPLISTLQHYMKKVDELEQKINTLN